MITKAEIFKQNLSLRLSEPADGTFLEAVYAETRRGELAICNWSREQEDAFFKMQFHLQNKAYAMQFPDADFYIVESKKMPIGILIVERGGEIKLVNIALLPQFRSQGIGTFLLEQLQTEAKAADKPLTLHVLKTNERAVRLYQRRGFTISDDNEIYLAMRWQNS